MYVLAPSGNVQAFPYSIDQLKKDNASTSFCSPISEADLAAFGVFPVKDTAPPAYDESTHRIENAHPEFIGGEWVRSYNIVALSAEEVNERTIEKSELVRAERNAKLAESDWTQLQDTTVNQQAWAVYRQGLRDIPQQAGFPWTVNWPSLPQ